MKKLFELSPMHTEEITTGDLMLVDEPPKGAPNPPGTKIDLKGPTRSADVETC